MATANTFDMAAPPVVRICLYGDLQRFGRRICLSIKTAAEGIHALAIQLPGFRQRMNEGWYQVRIAGSDMAPETITARLNEPLPPGAVVHIVPRIAGAKNGIWQVVAGAALIGASFIPGLNAVAATALFSAGTSMALGGVAQMLAPVPKTPAAGQTDNGKQNMYFSSLDNMVAQGNPLPVLYGEMQIGSRVISQMMSTRDENTSGKVVVIGFPLQADITSRQDSGITRTSVVLRQ
ncbi:tail assembly protein [Salmonella enterica subsp. salamae]|nr:tail assembly protein [Salmonella enterica subsp. salamae]ECI4078416.1 tail assembly protein [Salmonella enterica subsp. salamae]EEO2383420.1 tail assembly protein [Salmonella enterica]